MSFSVTAVSGTNSRALPGHASIKLWPNPLPLDGGIIRTQDRHIPATAGLFPKRFNVSVSFFLSALLEDLLLL